MHQTSLPPPDPEAAAHSARLGELIRSEIAASGGSIPFERFMELALYAPGLGYYRAGARKFGAAGDFITAPELSPLFSRCLARQCQQVLMELGDAILELGPGSGVMTADILLELEALECLPKSYYLLELSGELRQRQRATLEACAPHLLPKVAWLETLPESGFRGLVLGNEVLDAIPFQRFRITERGPRPLHVALENDDFIWREGPEEPTLTAAVDALGPLAPGYESEINLQLGAWLATLADMLESGVLLFIDYGYPRREYYHPQRRAGTLLCHYRHRVHDNPFMLPGLQDITANIDFTAVAEAALTAGLTVAGYASQSYFLFGCGLESLLAKADPDATVPYAELTRQVKLLTLPSEMGERFKAIALARGLDTPLKGFSYFDERGRL